MVVAEEVSVGCLLVLLLVGRVLPQWPKRTRVRAHVRVAVDVEGPQFVGEYTLHGEVHSPASG